MNSGKLIFSVRGFRDRLSAESWANSLNVANAKNGLPVTWFAVFDLDLGVWRVARPNETTGAN